MASAPLLAFLVETHMSRRRGINMDPCAYLCPRNKAGWANPASMGGPRARIFSLCHEGGKLPLELIPAPSSSQRVVTPCCICRGNFSCRNLSLVKTLVAGEKSASVSQAAHSMFANLWSTLMMMAISAVVFTAMIFFFNSFEIYSHGAKKVVYSN